MKTGFEIYKKKNFIDFLQTFVLLEKSFHLKKKKILQICARSKFSGERKIYTTLITLVCFSAVYNVVTVYSRNIDDKKYAMAVV